MRRNLNELPESLDETYERLLREIRKPNRDHALRLLRCLVVAIRPLSVKELAEVLAVDFDDAGGIPKLKPDWRSEDEEQALLTSCSSLIMTVETEDSRIVQFSHFSVKEYLVSKRLANSIGDVSRYHIDLEPAHTILAQVCMGILLESDDHVEEHGGGKRSPLAKYAAEHWVTHAQFERVSSFLRKPMEYLFNLDMPHFAAWLQLHDIDTNPKRPFHDYTVPRESGVTPLFYAALCGFQDFVELLVVKHPQHVNPGDDNYGPPLVAALAGRHFAIARHLLHIGARVDVCNNSGRTPLSLAAWYGDLEMVQILLDYKADANARGSDGWAPLHVVPQGSSFFGILQHGPRMLGDVAQALLVHDADVNAWLKNGWTPMHVAARYGAVEVIRALLVHGAKVGAKDDEGNTPLHMATRRATIEEHRKVEVVRELLVHGADVGAKDNTGRTPLHKAVDRYYRDEHTRVEVIRVLREYDADFGAKANDGSTPLEMAFAYKRFKVIDLLYKMDAEDVS